MCFVTCLLLGVPLLSHKMLISLHKLLAAASTCALCVDEAEPQPPPAGCRDAAARRAAAFLNHLPLRGARCSGHPHRAPGSPRFRPAGPGPPWRRDLPKMAAGGAALHPSAIPPRWRRAAAPLPFPRPPQDGGGEPRAPPLPGTAAPRWRAAGSRPRGGCWRR